MFLRTGSSARIVGLVLGLSGFLPAAVFPRFTAEELTARSQLIVQGTVVRSWAAWDSDHQYIWTHYQVNLSDVIRGANAASLTVSEPGGSLDGITQVNTGAISYTPGESDILFLFQVPNGYWRTAGGPQGKFAVESGGRVRGGASTAVYAERAGRAPSGTALTSLDGLTLSDFKNRVRQLAVAHPFQEQ
ncbi:MAG: hypothetical protein LAP40_04915 [Acidobacteriia bacterium]|nr:hypothetical protein [Terriglobia bacterium]